MAVATLPHLHAPLEPKLIPDDNAQRCLRAGMIRLGDNISTPSRAEILERNAALQLRFGYLIAVKGHCMFPTFEDGDVIVFDASNGTPKKGELVHVLLGYGPMIKRWYPMRGGMVRLACDDSQFPDLLLKPTTGFRILGVAVELVSRDATLQARCRGQLERREWLANGEVEFEKWLAFCRRTFPCHPRTKEVWQ